MTVEFLCVADIHIGRVSSIFDGETALSAWERIVDEAISRKVAAVLVAGDLFDDVAAQFRHREFMLDTLKRLKSHGVWVLAVAGNHDCSALPRFASLEPDLIKVFPTDRWEVVDFHGIRIVGRSFKDASAKNLLENLDLPPAFGTTIGLLHGDLNNTTSPYNPVTTTELQTKGVDAWILGHIHATKQLANVIYPGSPQALDAAETGMHGCYLLKVGPGGCQFTEFVPISTVRYESVTVKLGIDDCLDVKLAQILGELRLGKERIALRVTIDDYVDSGTKVMDHYTSLGADKYSIVRVNPCVETDLIFEAEQNDAGGQAARLLLGLKGEGCEEWQKNAADLIDSIREKVKIRVKALANNNDERLALLSNPDENELIEQVRGMLLLVLKEARERGVA